MLSAAREMERGMDYRLAILGAQLINALGSPKEPVRPQDIFPWLAEDEAESDPEDVWNRAVRVMEGRA